MASARLVHFLRAQAKVSPEKVIITCLLKCKYDYKKTSLLLQTRFLLFFIGRGAVATHAAKQEVLKHRQL